MTEQEQVISNDVSKELSDISPKWARRLNQPLPFLLSLTWLQWYFEIKHASKCVVGEAYGFSSSYLKTCKECNRFCVKFMYSFMLHSSSNLDKIKQRFVRHWNDKHVEMHSASELLGMNTP